MDAQLASVLSLAPWLIVIIAGVVTLMAALAARAAAHLSRAAAADAERAAASLIQLHRDTERLQALIRDELAMLRNSGARVGAQAAAPVAKADVTRPLSVQASAPVRAPVPAPASIEDDDDVAAEEATLLVLRPSVTVQAKDQFHGMPILRISAGPGQGQEFKLPFERCTMGRAPNNRVVLAEEKASRVHAEVRYEGNRFFLKDSGSTNGTLRNGAAVTESVLEFGDVISIGKTDMVFTCEGFDIKDTEPARAIAAFERTLEREGDFVPALQNLAFLLERDVTRRREAEGLWKRLQRLSA